MKKIFFVLFVFLLTNCALAGSQVDEAIEGLNSLEWNVRVKSAIILGRAKDFRAVKPLINALGDENYYVRERAKNALIQIGKPAFDLIIISLGDIDWHVRKRAAYVLGEINDENAVSFLINTLRDGNTHVVNAAGNALIKIGVPAVDSVISLLEDRDADVQKKAGHILAQIGKPAVEPLINEFKNTDWYTAVETIRVLGEIGDFRAIEPITISLNNKNSLVRWEAVCALGKIGDSRAIEFVTPMLNDEDDHVRAITKEVVEKMRNTAQKELSITAFKN